MPSTGQYFETPCWTSWSLMQRFAEVPPVSEPLYSKPPSLVSALHRDDEQRGASTMPARWPNQRLQKRSTGEAAMSGSNYAVFPDSEQSRVKCWLSNILAARATLRELAAAGEAEAGRMARDFNMSAGELRALVANGPAAANLLDTRLAQLGVACVDEGVDTAVMRDLQRICTLCEERRQCKQDLLAHEATDGWKRYCPNASTLEALQAGKPTQK